MPNIKYTNLTVYVLASQPETIKKNCKATLNSLGIKDKDWDEVKNAYGQLVAMTAFVKTTDVAAATTALLAVTGVASVVAGESVEPTCVISSPINGSTVAGIISLEAVLHPEAKKKVKRVDYLVDDTLVGSASVAPFTVSMDTTTLSNGNHVIQAYTYDSKNKLIGKSAASTVTTSNVFIVQAEGTISFFRSQLPVGTTVTIGTRIYTKVTTGTETEYNQWSEGVNPVQEGGNFSNMIYGDPLSPVSAFSVALGNSQTGNGISPSDPWIQYITAKEAFLGAAGNSITLTTSQPSLVTFSASTLTGGIGS